MEEVGAAAAVTVEAAVPVVVISRGETQGLPEGRKTLLPSPPLLLLLPLRIATTATGVEAAVLCAPGLVRRTPCPP